MAFDLGRELVEEGGAAGVVAVFFFFLNLVGGVGGRSIDGWLGGEGRPLAKKAHPPKIHTSLEPANPQNIPLTLAPPSGSWAASPPAARDRWWGSSPPLF